MARVANGQIDYLGDGIRLITFEHKVREADQIDDLTRILELNFLMARWILTKGNCAREQFPDRVLFSPVFTECLSFVVENQW